MVAKITLTIDDSDEAATFIRDLLDWPNEPLLTPVQENKINFSKIEIEVS